MVFASISEPRALIDILVANHIFAGGAPPYPSLAKKTTEFLSLSALAWTEGPALPDFTARGVAVALKGGVFAVVGAGRDSYYRDRDILMDTYETYGGYTYFFDPQGAGEGVAGEAAKGAWLEGVDEMKRPFPKKTISAVEVDGRFCE